MELNINNFDQTQQLYEKGLSVSEIENHLRNEGKDETELSLHLSQLKRLIYEKQRAIGFRCLTLGAVFCLAGCIFTFMHDYSSLYAGFTLYGMTIVGTCLVLWGLTCVLGL